MVLHRGPISQSVLKTICFIAIIVLVFGEDCSKDIHCTFCSEVVQKCLTCENGFKLNEQSVCESTFQVCPFGMAELQNSSDCTSYCPQNQLEFLVSSEKTKCQSSIMCPIQYSLGLGEQITSLQLNPMHINTTIGMHIFISTTTSLYLLTYPDLLQIAKISGSSISDQMVGFKTVTSPDFGGLILTWFQSSLLQIYSIQNASSQVLLLNIYVSYQVINAFIAISSVTQVQASILIKENASGIIKLIVLNIILSPISPFFTSSVISTFSDSSSIGFSTIQKSVFQNSTAFTIIATSTTYPLSAYIISAQDPSTLIPQKTCDLSSGFSKIIGKEITSNNQIAYLSSNKVQVQSGNTCSLLFSTGSEVVRRISYFVSNLKVLLITDQSLYVYEFNSIDQVWNQLKQVSNIPYDLVLCLTSGITPTSETFTCQSTTSSIYLITFQQIATLDFSIVSLFKNSFNLNSIYFRPIQPLEQQPLFLVGSQTIKIIFQFAQNPMIETNPKNCIFSLNSTYYYSQEDKISERVGNIISTSNSDLLNQNTKKIIILNQAENSLFPQFPDQLNKIANYNIANQIILISSNINKLTIIDFQQMLTLKYERVKLMGMQVKFSAQINSAASSSQLGQTYVFEQIIFTSNVNKTSSITVSNKSEVIFKKVVLTNFTISDSTTFFTFINCTKVIFKDVAINNVTIGDPLSQLIKVQSSSLVRFENVNITRSRLSTSNVPFISLTETDSNEFNQVLLAGNSFPTPPTFGTIIGVFGGTTIGIDSLTSKRNMNTASLVIQSSFLNQNNYFTVNPFTKVFATSVLVSDNIGGFSPQIKVDANYFMAQNITVFNNTQAASNGTLHVSKAHVIIEKSIFENNSAYGGGAIYFNQTTSAQIIESQFVNNSAIASGGAILLAKCYLMLNNTSLRNNSAQIGGAVRIEKGLQNFVEYDDDCIFENNQGLIFGNNIASRLQSFKIFVNGMQVTQASLEVLNGFQKEVSKLFNYTVENALGTSPFRSGDTMDILIQIFDSDKRLFLIDPSKAYPPTIQLELRQLGGIIRSSSMLIFGENQISDYSVLHSGFFGEGLILQGRPNSNLPFVFIQNFIESAAYKNVTVMRNLIDIRDIQMKSLQLQQPDSQQVHSRVLLDFSTVISIISSDIRGIILIVVNFRDCQMGEIIQDTVSNIGTQICLPCPNNSYTLTNNETACKKCPDSAYLCENSTIILQDGYWRENSVSDNIFACDNTFSSCQEFTLKDSHRQCKPGYIGPLCTGCDLYAKDNKESYTMNGIGGECLVCDNSEKQFMYFFLIFVFTTIYLVIGVTSQIQSTNRHSLAYYVRIMGIAAISNSSQSDLSSQYMKILLHYLQLIAVINSVNIQLPDFVGFLPKLSGSAGTSLILSTSCLMSQSGVESILQARVLQSAFLPFIYFLSLVLTYLLLCGLRMMKFRNQFIYTTFIFLIMFFQPDSMKFLLSSVGCKSLGNSSYLIADTTSECYTNLDYKHFMFAFTIPALVFWSLCPLGILFLLYRRRDKLNRIVTRNIFGYLYLEFKSTHYYFEFIRCLTKIVIVAFFTLSTQLYEQKLSCVVLILSSYIITSIKLHPFLVLKVQYIDLYSHINLILVIFINIMLHGSTQETSENNAFSGAIIFFVMGHVLFLILLIISQKMQAFNHIINPTLIFFEKKFGKIFQFLNCLKIIPKQSSYAALFRWKILKKSIDKIVQQDLVSKMNKLGNEEEQNLKAEFQQNLALEIEQSMKSEDTMCKLAIHSPKSPTAFEKRILSEENLIPYLIRSSTSNLDTEAQKVKLSLNIQRKQR